ncbi:hypothetical protein Salat_2081600 [Sesamum alatum]|uniref:Uncharacterized protein n=1 Tax=Sesamum alatum TaxID=300844 RepID=A0AAE2CGF6_9LAMI|nr:hypothetical protein Salat_2081600 [Sesamum alatum]
MGGLSTSDWTSSGTSGPDSPPFTSRVLPQKIREKMPRRSRAFSSSKTASPTPVIVSSEAMAVISGTPTTMTEELIRKIVTQVAFPAHYEWILPLPSESANNPPPWCLAGFLPANCCPTSIGLVISFLLCSQLYGFDLSVENFLGVLAPKLTTRECFIYLTPRPGLTFIRDKPSSHGAWKSRLLFVRKPEWGVPVA